MLALVAGAFVALIGIAGGAAAGEAQAPSTAADPGAAAAEVQRLTADEIEARYGIRIDRVGLASAGYMVDLRYWVLDADKAWTMFKDLRQRGLIHPKSGAKLVVPAPAFVGPLAQTSEKPTAGKRYFMFFANPGKLVEKGDEVLIRFDNVEVGPLQVR